MATTSVKKPSRAVQPLIKVAIETNPDGEVGPSVPITWALTEAGVAAVNAYEPDNLCLVVMVGRAEPDDYTGISKLYMQPLKDALRNRKMFVRFRYPGKNTIIAGIVVGPKGANIYRGLTALSRQKRIREDVYNPDAKKGNRLFWLPNDYKLRFLKGASLTHVQVPKELFAAEPPKWAKTLVRKFFPYKEVDTCDFKRHFILASLGAFFVQAYGLIVRPAGLLAALSVASRGMSIKRFFAFNPHDFLRGLRQPWWYFDEKGNERNWIWWVLSLPGLLVIGLVTVFLSFPTLLLIGISTGKDTLLVNWSDSPLLGLCTVTGGSALWLLIGLFFERFRDKIDRIYQSIKNRLGLGRVKPSKNEQPGQNSAKNIAELQQLVEEATVLVPPSSADNTISLRAKTLKTKVCKPYAG